MEKEVKIMNLQLVTIGKPEAFWSEDCPSDEEISERTNESGDYESASETVYSRREPDAYDGDTDAILVDRDTGKTVRYDYRDGRCYTECGDPLDSEAEDAAHEAGVPEGNASDDEQLKELIANTNAFIGSPENVTFINRETECDD